MIVKETTSFPCARTATVNTAVFRSEIAVLSCFGAKYSAVGSGHFNAQRISFQYDTGAS